MAWYCENKGSAGDETALEEEAYSLSKKGQGSQKPKAISHGHLLAGFAKTPVMVVPTQFRDIFVFGATLNWAQHLLLALGSGVPPGGVKGGGRNGTP